MHEEMTQSDRSSKKRDTILVIVLIAAIIFANAATSYLSQYMSHYIPQGLTILMLLGLVYYVYKMRIVSYGYVFVYREPDPEEDIDEFGNPLKFPYPAGTFAFAYLVSVKASKVYTVDMKDVLGIFAPDEPLPDGEYLYKVMTSAKKQNSYKLLSKSDGTATCWYFSPSKELAELLTHETAKNGTR